MAFEVDNPIPDEEKVYRRVPKAKKKPEDFWVVAQNKPTSAVFRDREHKISVDREKKGGSPETARRPNSLAVLSLLAQQCRSCGKEVTHDPVQEGDLNGPNEAHSIICDPPSRPMDDEEDLLARDAMARIAQIAWMAPGEPNFT